MEPIKPTVSLFLDKRREKKGGKYPIKVRVYFDDEDSSYKTGVDLSEEEWLRINNPKVLRDDNLRIARNKLKTFLDKAAAIASSLEAFSFQKFKELYFQERKLRKFASLMELFREYIDQLEKNEQIGTAISYKTTMNSINKFKPKLNIPEITTDFLFSYEKYLKDNNRSPSTIGIYMRQLRCIVNVAISQKLMNADNYPFKGYQIPTSRNIKKALAEQDIKALLNFVTDDINKRKALDFWLFSYLSNGMNMADICLLRIENIESDFFYFTRVKTKNTKKKDLRPIKVALVERSREIIDRWKDKRSNSIYLFPILEDGLTAKQVKYRIQDFIAFINKNMKEVAKDLNITNKVGTYVARHTHSTVLKRRGVPTELIKENLGHSSVLTTESYLGDFTDNAKLDFAKLLTDL